MPTTLSGKRLLADTVDCLVMVGFLILASIGLPRFFVVLFMVLAFLYAFFHDMFGGAGVGKRFCGIAVQTTDGRRTGPVVALSRMMITFLPVVGVIDFLICFFSNEGQRPSDRMLGWRLVRVEKAAMPRPTAVELGLAAVLIAVPVTAIVLDVSAPKVNSGPRDIVPERSYEGLVGVDRLTTAVENGDMVETNRLIESGVDINGVDKFGNTPISKAVVNGDVEMFDFLEEKHALLCMYTGTKETPGGERLEALLTRVMAHPMADTSRAAGRAEILKKLQRAKCGGK